MATGAASFAHQVLRNRSANSHESGLFWFDVEELCRSHTQNRFFAVFGAARTKYCSKVFRGTG